MRRLLPQLAVLLGLAAPAAAQQTGSQAGPFFVLPGGGTLEKGVTAAITDTTSTAIMAAAAAGIKHYVMACKATNSHATVGTFVKILDGSTIIDEGYAAPASNGWSTSYGTPLPTTAATALNCQPVTTGANVICSCNGYQAP